MVQYRVRKKDYVIFTECKKNGKGYRKYLRSGSKIRVDLFNKSLLWRVSELLRVKDWKIESCYSSGNCNIYYINIL
jgi:hypothetical protein